MSRSAAIIISGSAIAVVAAALIAHFKKTAPATAAAATPSAKTAGTTGISITAPPAAVGYRDAFGNPVASGVIIGPAASTTQGPWCPKGTHSTVASEAGSYFDASLVDVNGGQNPWQAGDLVCIVD